MVELWDVLDKEGNRTGRIQERGWMQPGNYHLIVNVWIKNKKGKFLIAKRTPNKRWPNLWGTTIGSAVKGDDSLTTAIKEAEEELGVSLTPNRGRLFKRYRNEFPGDCGEFIDVWLFGQEVDINKVILKADETCDVKWASREDIMNMIKNKEFIPLEDLPYIDELFNLD